MFALQKGAPNLYLNPDALAASIKAAHFREASVLTTFVIGIITGALGVAYIVYGRRQTKFVPLIAGVFLCAYPYFIDSLVWLCVVGALLLAAPFVIDF